MFAPLDPTSRRVLPLKFNAEFLAVQDRGDAIDSSPECGPNCCVKCLRDGTLEEYESVAETLYNRSAELQNRLQEACQ